jgi:hypothetical protein
VPVTGQPVESPKGRVGPPDGLTFDHARGGFAAELDGIGGLQLADGTSMQHAIDDIALVDADGLVANDAGAVRVIEFNAFAVGRDDDQLLRGGMLGADAEQARQEPGWRVGRRANPAFDLHLHQIGIRPAHRDAPHQQGPEVDARRGVLDVHMAALVVHIDARRAKAAGDRATHILDMQRYPAQLLGQARDANCSPASGVDDPAQERQHQQDKQPERQGRNLEPALHHNLGEN